jgi:hypothetical protein
MDQLDRIERRLARIEDKIDDQGDGFVLINGVWQPKPEPSETKWTFPFRTSHIQEEFNRQVFGFVNKQFEEQKRESDGLDRSVPVKIKHGRKRRRIDRPVTPKRIDRQKEGS